MYLYMEATHPLGIQHTSILDATYIYGDATYLYSDAIYLYMDATYLYGDATYRIA